MSRNVLVPVNGGTGDADVFACVLTIGRLIDAHIVALHVRPDVRRDIASMAAGDGGMAAGIDTLIERMEVEADAREQAATAHWQTFCKDNGIAVADSPRDKGLTSEWVSEIGTEADWVAEYGRTADMVIVGRGDPGVGPDFMLMEAALMDTGKPVVIAPARKDGQSPPPIDGIIGIAWKDTREAGGAVAAALPFIRAAKHVTIFIVPEDEPGSENSHLRLARMLRWHNPHVSVQPLLEHSRRPAEVMLDAAHQAGCGMLIMGGYGHTRLREAVFGGFTRAVMEDAPLPVFMAH